MPTQPSTDRRLAETSGSQRTTGARILLLGGVLFVVGLICMLAGDGFWDYAGVALAALATPPTLAGVALMLSGLVGRRASEHRPFA